jgi:hypothetical protein
MVCLFVGVWRSVTCDGDCLAPLERGKLLFGGGGGVLDLLVSILGDRPTHNLYLGAGWLARPYNTQIIEFYKSLFN